jgi:hypothetical protein
MYMGNFVEVSGKRDHLQVTHISNIIKKRYWVMGGSHVQSSYIREVMVYPKLLRRHYGI